MSITVRLFTFNELQEIIQGKNENLGCILANKKTFNNLEIATLYQIKKDLKTYNIDFGQDDMAISVYAYNDENLKWFLSQEYHVEQIIDIREVILNMDFRVLNIERLFPA